jgi:RNA polymerase sigma-70 factor (ECF subfamily)
MPREPEQADDLGRLYDRFGPSLYRYALMILADRAGAEDAVHEVFVRLARRPPRHVESTDAFLRVAVRNECYSQLRRTRARPSRDDDMTLIEAASNEAHPAERLALEHALRQLPPDQREVVHLKMFEGLTFKEIAALTDESVNTIAGRYRYALDKLRKELGFGESS